MGQVAHINAEKEVDAGMGDAVASATEVDLGKVEGNSVHITGTTTIAGFGKSYKVGVMRTVVFDGILDLTDSATLILPGGDITTAAGDVGVFLAEDLTGTWRCVSFQTAIP